jgi:pimeloyl-ACP methyl ester carboxylesterase
MTDQKLIVDAPDGRRLAVLTAGPASGLPLLLHTGTPGGLVADPSMTAAAEARGLRLIMCCRPGYGASTPRPGRRVVDVTDDAAAVLAALNAAEFVTAGWSGGGPHALACAMRMPGCLAVASIAGVAPYQAQGLDWFAGMGQENVEEFGEAVTGEAELSRYLTAVGGPEQITAEQVAAALGGLVSAPDEAVLTGGFAEYLAASMSAAVAGGIAGWRDDDLAFVSDWGFRLDEPGAAPAAIWQGDEDRMVPAAHGAWLAGQVPGARAHLLRGEGHLTLAANKFGDILDDLLDLAGRG